MIKINTEEKTINFRGHYIQGEKILANFERKLLLGYVCPSCKFIISAYWATPNPIEYWLYEDKEPRMTHHITTNFVDKRRKYKESNYSSFNVGGGQGITFKDTRYHQCETCRNVIIAYNINYAIQAIIEKQELHQYKIKVDHTKVVLDPDKRDNLKKYFTLIPEITGNEHDMLSTKFPDIYTEYYKDDYYKKYYVCNSDDPKEVTYLYDYWKQLLKDICTEQSFRESFNDYRQIQGNTGS